MDKDEAMRRLREAEQGGRPIGPVAVTGPNSLHSPGPGVCTMSGTRVHEIGVDGECRWCGADVIVIEATDAAEHVSTEPEGWLPIARKVVETGTFVVVDDMVLDQFSASAMVQVYDALRPEHQERFAAMHIIKAHNLTFAVLEKARR